ncbi:MAG TPA: DNA-directed RNA polymerase subunit omega [Gammaproteobacteria bacterium]|nr:DNA-directed RNA polymerase subunit omega [Gammaproteobacteria bacterium]
MARLTVEDCLEHIDNRYDLVILAAKRARQITFGSDPLVKEDRDKPTVLALREVAEGIVTPDNIDDIGKTNVEDEYEDEAEVEFPIPR